MMIRRGDRKYREFECSECEIKRHIYEIERENLYYIVLSTKFMTIFSVNMTFKYIHVLLL